MSNKKVSELNALRLVDINADINFLASDMNGNQSAYKSYRVPFNIISSYFNDKADFIQDIKTNIATLCTTTDTHADSLTAINGSIGNINGNINSINANVNYLSDGIDANISNITSIELSIDNLSDYFTTLSNNITAVIDATSSACEISVYNISSYLNTTIAEHSTSINTITALLTNIAGIDDILDEIKDDIDELSGPATTDKLGLIKVGLNSGNKYEADDGRYNYPLVLSNDNYAYIAISPNDFNSGSGGLTDDQQTFLNSAFQILGKTCEYYNTFKNITNESLDSLRSTIDGEKTILLDNNSEYTVIFNTVSSKYYICKKDLVTNASETDDEITKNNEYYEYKFHEINIINAIEINENLYKISDDDEFKDPELYDVIKYNNEYYCAVLENTSIILTKIDIENCYSNNDISYTKYTSELNGSIVSKIAEISSSIFSSDDDILDLSTRLYGDDQDVNIKGDIEYLSNSISSLSDILEDIDIIDIIEEIQTISANIDNLSTALSTDIDNLSTSLSTTTKLSVEELQRQVISNDNDINFLSGQHDWLSTALSTDIDKLSTTIPKITAIINLLVTKKTIITNKITILSKELEDEYKITNIEINIDSSITNEYYPININSIDLNVDNLSINNIFIYNNTIFLSIKNISTETYTINNVGIDIICIKKIV